MEAYQYAGTIASGMWFIMAWVGIPMQIRHTYKTGEWLSLPIAVTTTCLYSSWVAYALLKPDYYLLVPQLTWMCTSSIMLLQAALKKPGIRKILEGTRGAVLLKLTWKGGKEN